MLTFTRGEPATLRSTFLVFALLVAMEIGSLVAPGMAPGAQAHVTTGFSQALEPSLVVLVTGQKVGSAKSAKRTIKGTVLWGSLESVIQTAEGTMYTFDTKGLAAKRIFAACNADELCEAEGSVEGSDIISVSAVRKLGAPAAKKSI